MRLCYRNKRSDSIPSHLFLKRNEQNYVLFGLAYIQRYRNEVIMPRILNLLHNKVWHPHYFHFYTAVIYGQTLLTKSN